MTTEEKQVNIKIAETSDVYLVPYEMAKDIYLEMLTDEDLPLEQRLPKDVANRLALSIEEVTVRPFDNDESVCIHLKIRGSEQDIYNLNKVLQAIYDSID